MQTGTWKIVIRGLLIGLNHSLVIVVCLYLITSRKFAFEERAIYAMSSVLFWMGIQRLIKKLLPAE